MKGSYGILHNESLGIACGYKDRFICIVSQGADYMSGRKEGRERVVSETGWITCP